MKYILDSNQMKEADLYTAEHYGMFSIVLMERAALCLRDFIVKRFRNDTKVSVVCGTGNNGGDGLALVRLLREMGFPVKYVIIGDRMKLSKLAKAQLNILEAYECNPKLFFKEIEDCGLLVDAIFGTGLSRDLDNDYIKIIDSINELSCKKLAVDIPSGLNGNNGMVMGSAIKCDYTVTFGFRKLGHFLGEAREYSGELHCYQMGITKESLNPEKKYVKALEPSDIDMLLPKRRRDSHKGNFGKLLIIAGKKDMAGAAIFAAKSALAMGTGLVHIFTEEANREIIQRTIPEAMLSTYKEPDYKLLDKDLKWATTLLIGPGMGSTKDKFDLLKYAIENFNGPILIDADGITNLSRNLDIIAKKEVILTPHVGEMKRLTGLSTDEIDRDFLGVAEDFSEKHNAVCVLKSATTVVSAPDGETYLNMYGNEGMATGGSGDVLSGIIAGLLSHGLNAADAARLGVLIHALAGDKARDEVGSYSVTASKIIENIRHLATQ